MTNKPVKNHVHFYRREGRYNFLNSQEVSAQYVFYFPHLNNDQIKELGLTCSFLVDLEKDYDFSPEDYTPLECLCEIQSVFESYWIHTGKGEVKKVIEYLESIEEEQEKLRLQYALDDAIYQRDYWDKNVTKLQAELQEVL